MTFYVSEKDSGRYEAMNKGISHAKGEYLLFMNAGDCLYDDTVLHDVFSENKYTADIIYGNERVIYRDGSYLLFEGEKDFEQKAFWLKYYTLRHQACFIKKKLFDLHGMHDEKYISAADYERFLKFIYVEKCSTQFIDRFISLFKFFDGISTEGSKTGKREIREITHSVFGSYIYHKVEVVKFIAHTVTLPVSSKESRHAIRRKIMETLL